MYICIGVQLIPPSCAGMNTVLQACDGHSNIQSVCPCGCGTHKRDISMYIYIYGCTSQAQKAWHMNVVPESEKLWAPAIGRSILHMPVYIYMHATTNGNTLNLSTVQYPSQLGRHFQSHSPVSKCRTPTHQSLYFPHEGHQGSLLCLVESYL